jgi:cation:H+ antiporter
MVNDYLLLLAGVLCAGIGGELFVRGAVGLARWARISPGIIAATVAAFATSSPELAVSVSAALSGNVGIALGDALGSNVVNVALILALTLLIAGLQTSCASVKRDFGVAFAIPFLTIGLLLDGELSRFDGILLQCLFCLWLVATVLEARRQRSATAAVVQQPHWQTIAACGIGLGCLVAAGNFIVGAAHGIAAAFGIDEFIIGATLVAIGTSTPELATTLVAKLRGHDDVSLGTILGSNIFNGIFIVGLAALIRPTAVALHEVAVALLAGVAALALAWPGSSGLIGRGRGVLLLLIYVAYLAVIMRSPAAF